MYGHTMVRPDNVLLFINKIYDNAEEMVIPLHSSNIASY